MEINIIKDCPFLLLIIVAIALGVAIRWINLTHKDRPYKILLVFAMSSAAALIIVYVVYSTVKFFMKFSL